MGILGGRFGDQGAYFAGCVMGDYLRSGGDARDTARKYGITEKKVEEIVDAYGDGTYRWKKWGQ